jgi:hypothetical protein
MRRNEFDKDSLDELFELNSSGYLLHRESTNLEFKEQFNFSNLSSYLKDFAAFANNTGGFLVFGIKDSPRLMQGLSTKSLEMWEKIDPEKISEGIQNHFTKYIKWEMVTHQINDMYFGIFYIYEHLEKPVICNKEASSDLKDGEIYYRYSGKSEKIMGSNLESIINKRIEINNKLWVSQIQKIGISGPSNSAILDTERGIIEKDANHILVIEKDLIEKIKFIKEGSFSEKEGETTLRLVGDVQPINEVGVIEYKKLNLIEEYPLSASQVAEKVRAKRFDISVNDIWKVIKENDIKNNKEYSSYVFSNKNKDLENSYFNSNYFI